LCRCNHVIRDAALDAPHARQAAVARDVGGLARPRRQRARARHHEKQFARVVLRFAMRAVIEQLPQHRALVVARIAVDLDEMHESRLHVAHIGGIDCNFAEQPAKTKWRKRRSAGESQHDCSR
jgi:hypothetical protein